MKSKSNKDGDTTKNTSRFLTQQRKIQTIFNIISTYRLTAQCVDGVYFSTYDPSVVTGVSYLIYPRLLFVARKTQNRQTLLYAPNVVFFRYQSSLNNTVAALLKSTFQSVCFFYVHVADISNSIWYNVYTRTRGVVVVEEHAFNPFLTTLDWHIRQDNDLYILTRH